MSSGENCVSIHIGAKTLAANINKRKTGYAAAGLRLPGGKPRAGQVYRQGWAGIQDGRTNLHTGDNLDILHLHL